jgi:hypothetical protein
MLEATRPRPVLGHRSGRRRVSLRPGLGSSSPELSERSGAQSEESAAVAVGVASIVPLVPNASPDRIRRVRPPHDLGEIDNLAALLLHKVATQEPNRHAPSPDTIDVRAAYVHYRFAGRLQALQRSSRTYGRLDTALNLASIAAGIGASLVAASRSEPLWTISLGVAIAACQTLSQWLKPSLRAAQRGRAALELRTEAWNILEGHEQYRGKDVDGAWDIFCSQVDKIDGQAQRQEDAQSRQTTTVTLNGGGLTSHSDR